jgi:hypothetical protein
MVTWNLGAAPMNRYETCVTQLKGKPFLEGQDTSSIPDEILDAFEQTLGYSLPQDYREFLRDYGCFGFFEGATFPLRDPLFGMQRASLEVFYGFPSTHSYHLWDAYQSTQGWEAVPAEVLPIAEDAGANQVCICLAGKYIGKVFFWPRECSENPNDYSNLYLIADSFDEFLHLIYLID